MFVETNNDARRECRANEYFDISIGKTPPRKEAQWFSMNPIDCIWVSISDMGRCGMYIADSSEYLTHESVDKFNIKVVPDNTVLLSFKLTVGRVAITDGAMATNEAIAHFKHSPQYLGFYFFFHVVSPCLKCSEHDIQWLFCGLSLATGESFYYFFLLRIPVIIKNAITAARITPKIIENNRRCVSKIITT